MDFPNCKTHDVEQRSEEWFKLRSDKLTASKFGVWLSKDLKLKGTISAQKTAVYEVLGSMSGCPQPPDFQVDPLAPPPRSRSSFPIWRGIVLEAFATADFERITEMKVDEVGFCEWNGGKVGVSPDGKINGFNMGFETKAPDPKTHLKYLDNGILPPEYAAQCHGSMAVTGADSWWFFSYCPRWRWSDEFQEVEIMPHGLPPFILEVKRDSTTERYLDGFKAFQRELERQDKCLSKLYSKGGAK